MNPMCMPKPSRSTDLSHVLIIPLDSIFRFIREHDLHPSYAMRFSFDDIREACIALDEGKANGKIVVVMDQ